MKTLIDNILIASGSMPGVTLKKDSNSSELFLHNTSGNGKMVFYSLFPGIYLAFIHVGALNWPESDMNFKLRPLLVNYCVSGRSELFLDDNTYIYMKGQDISISMQAAQKEYIFPTRYYEGIKIYFDVDLMAAESKNTLNEFAIDFSRLEQMYCKNRKTYIAKATAKAEAILKRLWELSERPSLFYMKIYVLELLYTLLEDEVYSSRPCTFYTGIQVELAKKAEKILTSDLRVHYPIKKLAEQFLVSETSLKNYFRGVYGQNISSYLREYRMNIAAEMLSRTQKPISEISAQIGYTNQGKFAAIFRQQFAMSPLEYRRFKRVEDL